MHGVWTDIPEVAGTVSDLRRRYDLSILMVSHDLAGVTAVSDRIVFLNRRIVCAGAPAEVIANREVRHTFGLDFNLSDRP